MAIISRRWDAGNLGLRPVRAGADCDACRVACMPQSMGPAQTDWVCPRCAARAPVCACTYGAKACELVAGHWGDHESGSGTTWPAAPQAVLVPAPAPAPAEEALSAMVESLRVADLVSPTTLRAVARYLREQAATNPTEESKLVGASLKFQRIASDLDWAIGFVDGLDERNPGAADAIAKLVAEELAPKVEERPRYQAPEKGEW